MIPKYDLVEHLYQSSSTTIWRVKSQKDHSFKIIKTLDDSATSFDGRVRLQHEFKLAQKVSHPNLISFEEIISTGNTTALLMEDFGGVSLTEAFNGKRLALKTFFSIAISAAEALSALHESGIIHKDISPGNLLYNLKTGQFKLIDLGISSEVPQESQQLEAVSNLEGTLDFLAPEQSGRIAWPLDYRADFYSLGATLYYCLAGHPPFLTKDPLELIHAHLAKKPAPLAEVAKEVPAYLSLVIAKLLEKSPDDRYQSAQGLIYDLKECQRFWENLADSSQFVPGSKDISAKFKLPQTLFGREMEIELLSNEVEKASNGNCRLCLVTGEAGVGKSAVIGQAQNLIFREKGLFFSGKYDQLQAKTPFSALLQALSKMLQHILQEPETVKQSWQSRINSAIGQQGRVLLEVLPELEALLFECPAVEGLPALEAQIRFNRTFLDLIRALSHPDYPLIIFLDDLQWADEASLNFIEEIMGDLSIKNLLIIGAYRQNEVGPDHYLTFILGRLQQKNGFKGRIDHIFLVPLSLKAIIDLVEATFFVDPQKAEGLAQVLLTKTRGNPFFLHSYITSLFHQGAVHFNQSQSCWTWNLQEIEQQYVANNVLQLLLDRFSQLPKETVEAMGWAAVLSNYFNLGALSEVTGVSAVQLRERLMPALKLGYLVNLNTAYRYSDEGEEKLALAEYRFQHDQVQSAARNLIDPEDLKKLHLNAARQLYQTQGEGKVGERLFDIVRYYNEGCEQVVEPAERHRIIQLNLQAAQKSINANAYDVALTFANKGFELLGEQPWNTNHGFAFYLCFLRYETYFLSSKYEEMDQLYELLREKAQTVLEKVNVINLKMLAAGNTGFLKLSSELAVEASSLLGLNWPKSFGMASVVATLLGTKIFLRKFDPNKLDDLPPAEDPEVLMLHEIMLNAAGVLYQHDPNMFAIGMMIWTKISLTKGFSPRCVSGFVTFAIILMNTGSPKQAFAWADLASRLNTKHPNDNARGKTRFTLAAFIDPWRTSIHELINEYVEVIPISLRVGDTQYALFAANHIAPNMLWVGANLDEIITRRALNRPLMTQTGFTNGLIWDDAFAQTARCLQGKTNSSLTFDDAHFIEEEFQKEILAIEIMMVQLWYYIFKCFCLVFFGHYKEATHYGELAQKNRGASDGLGFMTAIDIFYGIALLRSAHTESERDFAKKQAGKFLKQLKKWATGCEANYLAPALLLEAEYALFLGKRNEAIGFYLESIGYSAKYNFVHFQALACEQLAKVYDESQSNFYYRRLYLREAVGLYTTWGAQGKVDQLIQANPDLRLTGSPSHGSLQTSISGSSGSAFGSQGSHIGRLDFESLLKTTQTLSEEINYQRLQEQLFNLIIENAGAQKAWLILKQNEMWQVVASIGEEIKTNLPIALEDCHLMSGRIMRRVIQSGEPVVVVNAKEDPLFSDEAYIQQYQVRSILCQPLILGKKLLGAVYLENNLISGCFTQERLAVLQVIASQASISLENARLFEEAKLARTKLEEYAQSLEQRVEQRTFELKEANETKDRFFSIIAHDLRGPIGSLSVIFNEVLNAGDVLEEELFESIRSTTKSTYELLENLLTWARNQKGLIEVVKGEILLNGPIEESCRLLQASAKAKGISLTYKINLTHQVHADASMITTVVRNLINNAIKFSTTHGSIQVVATEENGKAVVSVIDNGLGMSEEHALVLFDDHAPKKSFRGTGNERGTGLGLVLCKDFVLQNGGEIGVTSGLGKGSRFWFSLKLGEPIEKEEESSLPFQNKQIRTLLVEDDSLSLQASANVLKEIKILFDHAENGEIAVEMAKSGGYEVVWMDIEMPVMDGLTATEILRQIDALNRLKIVALSSYTEMELAKRVDDRPDLSHVYFDGYLAKPPVKKQIEKMLERLFAPGPQTILESTELAVLVIDDNLLNLKLAEKTLASLFNKVVTVQSGVSALKLLENSSFQLFFVDIEMPEMDGFQTTRQIRQMDITAPIIALTSHDRNEILKKGEAFGINEVITKPIHLESLKKLLEKEIFRR